MIFGSNVMENTLCYGQMSQVGMSLLKQLDARGGHARWRAAAGAYSGPGADTLGDGRRYQEAITKYIIDRYLRTTK